MTDSSDAALHPEKVVFNRPAGKPRSVIGVIADTHGMLRPQAVEALHGSDLILHAGDIGPPSLLVKLTALAPVIAVRGNLDRGPWANEVPDTIAVKVGDVLLYMLHERSLLDLKPEAAGIAAVIYGHTHVPLIERQRGVLYFNPGAAGPRRFKLPLTVGRLLIEGTTIEPELITLQV